MTKVSSKQNYKKILDHPDKEEILAKLSLEIPTKDIHEWLKAKYSGVSESKFVIADKALKIFKDEYLDFYSIVQADLVKTQSAMAVGKEEDLQLSIQGSSYKNIMIETANKQLDVRVTIAQLCKAVETRFAQVFDEIQEDPRNINTKVDRLLIDYTEVLGNMLEKFYKFTESPADQVIQHNVTLQVVDQHIMVLHDVIKEVLSQMDLESSMYFMELFNEKISRLKAPEKDVAPNLDLQIAETKLLSETINKKVNQ